MERVYGQICRPRELSLGTESKIKRARRVPRGKFGLIRLSAGSVARNVASFLHMVSSVGGVDVREYQRADRNCVAVSISEGRHNGAERRVIPYPPFLRFFYKKGR